MAHSYTPYEGYGRYARYLLNALHNAGVQAMPIAKEHRKWPAEVQYLSGIDFGDVTLSLMPGDCLEPIPGRQWGYSMIEATRVSPKWVKAINQSCERLLVPCAANAEAFKASGVTIPIHVVPGGTEPEDFQLLPDVSHPRPYTFLVLGDRGIRKGFEIVYTAFHRAFGGDPVRFEGGEKDVRLLIKARAVTKPELFAPASYADRRIVPMRADVETMAKVYPLVDCFVFASFFEGWGMPPREATMMGVPTIATRIGGLVDGIDEWAIPLDAFKMVAAKMEHTEDAPGAQWAMPDVDEVARLMRWCFDNRAEAKTKARQGAAWLRDNQTWAHTANAILALLETYA